MESTRLPWTPPTSPGPRHAYPRETRVRRSGALRQPYLRYHVLSGVEQRRQAVPILSKFFLRCHGPAEAIPRDGDELCQALGGQRWIREHCQLRKKLSSRLEPTPACLSDRGMRTGADETAAVAEGQARGAVHHRDERRDSFRITRFHQQSEDPAHPRTPHRRVDRASDVAPAAEGPRRPLPAAPAPCL